MNGNEINIEIFKPFGEAFELMKKTLFRPFDLRKWCVIGFAAFLAHLGGNFNFRFNYNRNSNDLRDLPAFRAFVDWINGIPHWAVISGIAVIVALILTLSVVFTWLRARGQFIFTYCVVENRAAIVGPWRDFRREGNSYFLLALLAGCGFVILAILLALPFFLPIIRGESFAPWHNVYLISTIVIWAVAMMLVVFAWVLITHIMVVVMYRWRCRAAEGLRRAIELINNFPAEMTLYCLFWIALTIGTVLVACVSMCVTCCVTAIPYVGTVVLLPLYVWLRLFGLLFFRQFGTEYDVWAGSPVPQSLPQPPPLPQ